MGSVSEDYRVVKERYAEFLKTPKDARYKKFGYDTKAAFATENRVDRKTIYRWDIDPDFIRMVSNDVIGTLGVDHVANIRTKLIQQAEDGHVPSIRELRNWAKLDEPPVVEEEEARKSAAKMSDAELDKMLAEEDAKETDAGS